MTGLLVADLIFAVWFLVSRRIPLADRRNPTYRIEVGE